jgi:hypothetical protein
MRIKKHNWTSFTITGDDISLITDPQELKKSGLSFTKVKSDIVLFSDPKLTLKEDILKSEGLDSKVVVDNRKKIIEISSPGEYEIGGLLIRRDMGTNFYIIDEQNLRVVYLGLIDNDFDVSSTEDLGDVDVLIAPIGNGDQFIDYDKLEKIFSNIDPQILIPCAYAEEGLKLGKELKSKEDFIKHFGFPNVSTETSVLVKPKKSEKDGTPMEVIFL